jgi:hypothetical protein
MSVAADYGAVAISQDFYAALASERPLEKLGRAVRRELDAGVPRERLVAQLEGLRSDLCSSGREDDEDVVLDVVDFLTGWSSPHMRL